MKRIINNNLATIHLERFRKLVHPHTDENILNQHDQHKKNIELCHVAKLLINLDNTSYIKSVTESPDFLIYFEDKLVGIEHQVLVDKFSKSYEGFFENIFQQAEIRLKSDSKIAKQLLNCWLHDNIEYTINEKESIISSIIDIIQSFLISGILKDNSIIKDIYSMPHDELALCPNFGAWFQKYLPLDSLKLAIESKERKLATYKKKANEIWLLIVISGANSSSYQISENVNYCIDSKFDRVYLLEDFPNNLYQLK